MGSAVTVLPCLIVKESSYYAGHDNGFFYVEKEVLANG